MLSYLLNTILNMFLFRPYLHKFAWLFFLHSIVFFIQKFGQRNFRVPVFIIRYLTTTLTKIFSTFELLQKEYWLRQFGLFDLCAISINTRTDSICILILLQNQFFIFKCATLYIAKLFAYHHKNELVVLISTDKYSIHIYYLLSAN